MLASLVCGCVRPFMRGQARRRHVLQAAAATVAAPFATGGAHAQAAATAPAATTAHARPRVINTHAHYYPQAWLDLVATDGKAFGGNYRDTPDGFFITGAGSTAGPLPRKFIDLRARIADMDAQGVDIQALSLTSPMIYWADADLSERLARAWNDGASDAHRQYPDRLYGLMILPMLDTDRALREFERARALPGIRGVYMGTNIAGRDLSDPRFLPVFKAAEAAGLAVFLHPLQTAGGERTRPYYLSNLIGNPLDTGIAAAHLIMGGVLDACPALEINLPHAGGIMPILTGRWDHGRDVRAELRHMTRPPSDYIRRFTYDTISHSAPIMRFVIAQVGIDRVTLGDDYCYDMGYTEPVRFVDGLDLAPEQRAMVLGDNAARLLRL
jgi:aminocarboxymuconate-semialdehyde decarboxylase